MIPESLVLAWTDEGGTRRRTRIERSGDGAWERLEEVHDGDEWRGVGVERVKGVVVNGELRGGFGQRDREGVADVRLGP